MPPFIFFTAPYFFLSVQFSPHFSLQHLQPSALQQLQQVQASFLQHESTVHPDSDGKQPVLSAVKATLAEKHINISTAINKILFIICLLKIFLNSWFLNQQFGG
jgi:hypothetical protein